MRAAYTWAHGLNDVDTPARGDAAPIQNVYNLHAQWGTAMTNVPQRFSLTAVYELPFGSSRRFIAHTPVVSQVIGHWKVSTVAQFQMGYPYNVSQGDGLNIFSGGQYVTKVGNPNIARGSRTIQKWFNTAAFMTTPQDTLGNAPRASLYAPGQNVWDLSLMRDIPLWERATFTVPRRCTQRLQPSAVFRPGNIHDQHQNLWYGHRCSGPAHAAPRRPPQILKRAQQQISQHTKGQRKNA